MARKPRAEQLPEAMRAVGMKSPQGSGRFLDADARTRMDSMIRSKRVAAISTEPNAIVEPVIGQIKEDRGLQRFLRRDLEKVKESGT